MIDPNIKTNLLLLQTNLGYVVPIESATKIQVNYLQNQTQELLDQIQTSSDYNTPVLDGVDPVGFAGDFIAHLNELHNATLDQSNLTDVGNYVGRALFNLTQARS